MTADAPATPPVAPAAAPVAQAPKTAESEKAKGDAQAQVDEEEAKGYRGTKVDPLPDEYYTFPGPSKEEHAKVTGDADVV